MRTSLHKICFVSFAIILLLLSCGGGNSPDEVIIETRAGDIEVKLYPDKAPKTVAAFLGYIDAGYYKKSSFYRILSSDNQPMGSNAAELIQGGVFKSGKNRENLQGIPHEPTSLTGLRHEHGTLSMARNEPGTATTEFFICIGDNPIFDEGVRRTGDTAGYAAFGRVTKGLDVVMAIYSRPENEQEFTPPIGIINIRRK